MIVLDASVVVDLLPGTPLAAQIETRLFRSGETLHAPHLIDVEVTQALRRLAIQRQIDPDRGRDALTDLADPALSARLARRVRLDVACQCQRLRRDICRFGRCARRAVAHA